MDKKSNIKIKLNEAIDISITRYNGETYVHLFQKGKNKNFSFNKSSLKMFFAIEKKILKATKIVERNEKAGSKSDDKKNGKQKRKPKHRSIKKEFSESETGESEMEGTEEDESDS